MDQLQPEDSGGLADAVERERLGRLVASRHPPQPTSAIPRRSKTKWVFLTLALTGGFLALAAGLFQSFRRSGVAPPPSSPSNPQSTTRPPYQPAIEHEMVAIPGGTFKMGRDDGPPTEGPSHMVTVQNFLLDKTEVTNAQYAEYVRAAGYPAPTCRYTATAQNLIPQIIGEPPGARRIWASGENDILTEKWEGKTVIDRAAVAACRPDEWLLIVAWDES